MPSSTEQSFAIYELVEHILLQLEDPLDLIRVQRVCRTWRDIIQTSPALQVACWYRPPDSTNDGNDGQTQTVSSRQAFKLNPVFNRIGIPISAKGTEEWGYFNLEDRFYDKPGSWTTMLATQPPCQRMLVECYSDYGAADENMYYLIVSMTGTLLMGDIMAILAECQNRQNYGLDRWAGVTHHSGRLVPWPERRDNELMIIADKMPNDVSIKVVVAQAWDAGDFPAFSLRRVVHHHSKQQFLHEMILHKMVSDDGHEYIWRHYSNHWPFMFPVCEAAEYKANLLVVREYQEGYLSDCRHIFRLLSDVE